MSGARFASSGSRSNEAASRRGWPTE
jgi:hypothetical protein